MWVSGPRGGVSFVRAPAAGEGLSDRGSWGGAWLPGPCQAACQWSWEVRASKEDLMRKLQPLSEPQESARWGIYLLSELAVCLLTFSP